jgi:hypothetical protein
MPWLQIKKVAGTLVPRIDVEKVMKLGFLLEYIYFLHYNHSLIEKLLYVEYITYFNYPKLTLELRHTLKSGIELAIYLAFIKEFHSYL